MKQYVWVFRLKHRNQFMYARNLLFQVILKFLKILHSDWEPIALKTDEVLKLYSLNGNISLHK